MDCLQNLVIQGLNSDRFIWFFGWHDCFTHFCAVFDCIFCSQPEKAGNFVCGRFVGLMVRDKRVNFPDPDLNWSREIPPEAVRGRIFGSFSNVDNFWPEVASYVVSSAIIEPNGVKDRVSFGDSGSSRSPDIRQPHFLMNERTTTTTTTASAGHHITG